MKSTGIVRNVDELGRVVIPIEIRRTLGIQKRDPLEIYVDDDSIILKKHTTSTTCFVTGESSEDNISLADGKVILSPEVAKSILLEIKDKLN